MQDQLIQKIVRRLVGIAQTDLTIAERQIVNILTEAGVVALFDGEVCEVVTLKPSLFLVNNSTLIRAHAPADAALQVYYHEEPDAQDKITEWLQENDIELHEEAAFAQSLLQGTYTTQEQTRAQAEIIIRDRLDGNSTITVIL